MQSKLRSIFKAGKLGIFLTVMTVGLASAFLLTSQLSDPIMQTVMNQKRGVWEALGDASPGTGLSGFLMAGTIVHSAAPAVTYASNISNASFYEFLDATTGEMTGTTPYGIAYDYLLKYRLNATDGFNSSSGWWTLNWSYVVMSCNFNWSIDVSNLQMTDVEIASNANYIWIYAYANNGGAGYQISKNEKFSWNTSGWVLR